MQVHPDWQRVTLQAWAKWVAAGRPLAFSPYGDSLAGKEVFNPRHRKNFRTDTALWEETGNDWLHELDARLHGALSQRERVVLLAACVPLGRPCPATERAQAVGVSVDQLRGIRRRALALVG